MTPAGGNNNDIPRLLHAFIGWIRAVAHRRIVFFDELQRLLFRKNGLVGRQQQPVFLAINQCIPSRHVEMKRST